MNILLIHGWNYENYYGRKNNIAWFNRIDFLNELKNKYNLYYPDLPGFGKIMEPKEKEWSLDDYAKYINEYIVSNNLKIDYILGYSFGGAVAVRYKTLFNNNIKIILVSPALIRSQTKSKKFIKTPNILKPIRSFLRNIYLIHFVKVEEMIYGTNFLRNTYQNIVRVNLLDELEKLNPSDFKIIYGSNDEMVNPNQVIQELNDLFKKRISIINEGKHDIANTHTKELINIINSFIDENK